MVVALGVSWIVSSRPCSNLDDFESGLVAKPNWFGVYVSGPESEMLELRFGEKIEELGPRTVLVDNYYWGLWGGFPAIVG